MPLLLLLFRSIVFQYEYRRNTYYNGACAFAWRESNAAAEEMNSRLFHVQILESDALSAV